MITTQSTIFMMSATLGNTPLPILLLRIFSPAIVLLSTLSLLFLHPTIPTSPSPIISVVVATRIPRRALILALFSLSALTFLLDGLTFVVYAVLDKVWQSHTGIQLNAVLGLAAFSGLPALGAWKDIHGVDVWSLKRIKASVSFALGLDLALVVLLTKQALKPNSTPHIPEIPNNVPLPTLLHLVFPSFRVLLLLLLFFALFSPRVVYSTVDADDTVIPTPSSFLLPHETAALPSTGLSPVASAAGDPSKYGTFRSARPTLQSSNPTTRAPTPNPSSTRDTKANAKPEIALDPSWGEVWKRILRISPYLWPSKSIPLQFLGVLCIAILIIGRFVNAVLPFTLGKVISIFETGSETSLWPYLFGYVLLRFLQGSGGLPALRGTLWAPVMQYSDREMSQLSFDHLMNLSLSFHTHRKTGEVLRILDRGAAINHTLELLLFSIVPTFVDIAVALVIFCITFQWTLALVIFFVMAAYITASVVLTTWRTKIRRQMNDRDVVTRGIHTDCLLNYETVKYFGGEEHEGNRYREAVREYQAMEYKVIISLNILNLVQNFIITLGLLIGSMIVALRVTRGQSQPSDFVIFITYLAQLYGPLNNLGSTYRAVNQSLVDTERLLKLLNEPTDVNDKPGALDLIVDDGEIEFDNVSFSYDGRTTALSGVSFKVPKGSSVALVGESGAGKSTILRLLYRFYDLGEGEGRILIDGKDIKDVTQASLRKAIGVVPQDPVLFNSSIGYNIGYGKFGSSPEEIEAAARSAQMHDRITTFPDGYDTKVGERGVRLSGGEKQRVAIARTLLKNPPILLLDEATSALDTSTEKDIQKALQNLVQGRSSLSIAHRLSTISSADLILVLKDGQIVEQGSHKQLIALDGLFASMWADQISSSEDPVSLIDNDSTKKEVSEFPAEATESGPPPEEIVINDVPRDISQIDKPGEPSVLVAMQGVPIVPYDVDEPTVDGNETEIAAPFIDLAGAASSLLQFPPSTDTAQASVARANSGRSVARPDLTPSTVPLNFPTSEDTASQHAASENTPSQIHAPAVTFGTNVNLPSRTGTPDPDAEPKRKRISSQNFQRLARKISLTTRRQSSSSSIIPGIKRNTSADDGSVTGEGSGKNSNASPAASLLGDDKNKKKDKKDKKDKKRKSLI